MASHSDSLATIVDPSPGLPAKLNPLVQAFRQCADMVANYQVNDQAGLDQVVNWVKTAKTIWKEQEGERTAITKPLWQAKRRVDDYFKPLLDALIAIETSGKAKIADYHTRVEVERRATMIISAAELATGAIPTHVIEAPAKAEGVTIVMRWAWEVVDPAAVPRELCSPDDAKIRAAIAYADTDTPPREVPGLRFYRAEQVRVRT